MERELDTSGIEPSERATLTATDEAVEHLGAVSRKTGGQPRRYLRTGWTFARHLLEMVAAMMVGMAALGAATGVFGEPPGYADPLVEYGLMGVSMSVTMVAWMRFRGHSWSDGLEMTMAMLAPMLALVLPVELGIARYVPGLSEDSLMMLSHAAMIVGMSVVMIYRRDRYAKGAPGHRVERSAGQAALRRQEHLAFSRFRRISLAATRRRSSADSRPSCRCGWARPTLRS